jgi:alpha-mannosidase
MKSLPKSLLYAALIAVLVVITMAETEAGIRARLGIPPSAKRVLILSQSSHMDWDWNETFLEYYNSEVADVLSSATSILAKYRAEKQPYYYSVAETGYLQQFWRQNPSALASLRTSGHTLHMVGGGITSPDSLLNHGEAFIRNFLVGQGALRRNGLPNITNIWVPDDFGHDGQLPVMVRAMGLGAAGFARVPGAPDQGPPAQRLDGLPSTAEQLMKEGVSFTWEAKDGSEMFAHWLQAHYNQGDSIDEGTDGDSSNCASYSSSYNSGITNSHILGYVEANGPTAVSPYMFVAIGDDFRAPKPCLLTYVANWNKDIFGSTNPGNDVYVLSATFDHYVALVKAYASNPANRQLAVKKFQPTPYWTGFYASRPELKILQEKAVRAALAAESLAAISTQLQPTVLPTIEEAWTKIAPSTHHDFVTGTSPDPVYQGEQIPYLTSALSLASDAAHKGMQYLANTFSANPAPLEQAALVYNPLGIDLNWDDWAPIYIPPQLVVPTAQSFFDGRTYRAIQNVTTPEGGQISTIGYAVKSFEFLSGLVSVQTPSPAHQSRLVLTVSPSEDTLVLENPYIRVKIEKSANWAATSIIDVKTGQELIQTSSRDLGAFSLEILTDYGNIYRFANEMSGCTMGSMSFSQSGDALNLRGAEKGPVRIRIPTVVSFQVNGQSYKFTRVYELFENDRMVRVSIEGKAPTFTSVFLRTPITFLQPMVTYGTPYHWDDHIPAPYWPGYTFFAAHNFVTLTSLEGLNIAFYSSMLRAWALDGTVVVTALFRNTPGGACHGYGADGSDSDSHRVSLAFRVPSGLSSASSLIPLSESLAYSTPLMMSKINQVGVPTNSNYYMRVVNANGSLSPRNAIITSIKPSEARPSTEVIIRVYSPTASPQNPIHLKLDSVYTRINHRGTLTPLTALENPLPEGDLSVTISSQRDQTFTMRAAIVTLSLSHL